MADTSRYCQDCGVQYDAGAADRCPVCSIADEIDRMNDDITDIQMALDTLRSRVVAGDGDD